MSYSLYSLEDSIFSISTAIGKGAIAVIRVSGRSAFSSINKLFIGSKKESLFNSIKKKRLVTGSILNPITKKPIDQIVLLIFYQPYSYTGQDMIEIQCHGGIYIIKRIVKLLGNQKELRLAKPGEFTYRAYLNDKIDLTQAEAINELILSRNSFEASQALSKLKKNFSKKIKDIKSKVIGILAEIEVNIDYSEEDLSDFSYLEFIKKVKIIKKSILNILKLNQKGKKIKPIYQIAIIGKTNVGKSSLFNYLSGEDRAIISSIEGTTRDYLENEVYIEKDLSCIIVDTAGLRKTEDIIEKIGQNKSLDFFNKADFFIWIIDYSSSWDDQDQKIFNLLNEKKILDQSLILINKIDLEQKVSLKFIEEIDEKRLIKVSIKNKKI